MERSAIQRPRAGTADHLKDKTLERKRGIPARGLTRSTRRNLKASGWFTGIPGTLGGGAGVGIGVGAVLVLSGRGGRGRAGRRDGYGVPRPYRSSLRGLTAELERLLQAVDAHGRRLRYAAARRRAGGRRRRDGRTHRDDHHVNALITL